MRLSGLFKRYVNWLEARKLINILLVLAYFVYIFLMHVPMAKLSVWVMNLMGLPVYNVVVMWVSVLLLAVYMALIGIQLKRNAGNRWLKIVYLLLVLSFIILHFCFMFEMNIEIIHIFQYSILAFLIFPLTRRFGATVFFAIPFMLIDEWNQYINLYPGFVQYFEFNDVILDIDGCGLAMVTLLIFGVKGAENLKPLWRRTEFISLCIFAILIATALRTCFIALYTAGKCANTFLVLNIVPTAPAFWSKFPNRDVIYHIMQPMEAIIAIVVFSLFYFGLDEFRQKL